VQTDASTEHCSSAAWADVMSHTHGRIESVSVSLSWCLKFQLNANRVASDRYYFVKRHLTNKLKHKQTKFQTYKTNQLKRNFYIK